MIFIYSHEFEKQRKRLKIDEEMIKELELLLIDNPKIGQVLRGTGKLRKMRLAGKHSGKSRGYRINYIDFEKYSKIFMVTVYPKNEKSNLTIEEINYIKKLINRIEESIKYY